MKVENEVYIILKANEKCLEQKDGEQTLHGYETIGFVKTKLKALKALGEGGNYKDSNMPLYICQKLFKIK